MIGYSDNAQLITDLYHILLTGHSFLNRVIKQDEKKKR